MISLNISLPESVREFVENQVAKGGYETASDYIHQLIREAQQREEQERLEVLLLEGLDSGPGIEATSEYWQQKRAGASRFNPDYSPRA